MAGTTKVRTTTALDSSAELETRLQHNALVDDVETLRAAVATLVTKLNADSGVADTDYASVAGASLTAAKVAGSTGSTTV